MAMERDQKTLVPEPVEDQTIKLEWKKGRIGVPHAFSRSNLFSAGRRYKLNRDINTDITTNGGFNVQIRGATTSMSVFDLTVFLAIMHQCWTQDDDATNARQKKTRISCSLGDLASIMGHPRNTSTAQNIFNSLRRLSQTIIEIDGEGYFSGSLINLGSDQPTSKISTGYRVEICVNSKLQNLYSAGHWAALNPRIISSSGRNYMAIRLYCFFGSHKHKTINDYYYGLNKLQSLLGSNLQSRMFVSRLRKALEQIYQISYDLAGPDDLVFRYALTKTKGKGTYKVSVNYQRKYALDQMQKPLIDLRDVIYIPPEQGKETLRADALVKIEQSDLKDPIEEDAERFDSENSDMEAGEWDAVGEWEEER